MRTKRSAEENISNLTSTLRGITSISIDVSSSPCGDVMWPLSPLFANFTFLLASCCLCNNSRAFWISSSDAPASLRLSFSFSISASNSANLASCSSSSRASSSSPSVKFDIGDRLPERRKKLPRNETCVSEWGLALQYLCFLFYHGA